MMSDEDSRSALAELSIQSLFEQLTSDVGVYSTKDVVKNKNTCSGVYCTSERHPPFLPSTQVNPVSPNIRQFSIWQHLQVLPKSACREGFLIPYFIKG